MLGTFLKLKEASNEYKSDSVFTAACKFSTKQTSVGTVMGFILLGLSLLLVLFSVVNLSVSE